MHIWYVLQVLVNNQLSNKSKSTADRTKVAVKGKAGDAVLMSLISKKKMGVNFFRVKNDQTGGGGGGRGGFGKRPYFFTFFFF